MKYILYIFYGEIALNLVSIVMCLFAPTSFLAQFSNAVMPAAALEVARWYGVLLLVISYFYFRALRARGTTLKFALEALLVGDIVQIAVATWGASTSGQWTPVVIFTIVASLFLGGLRLLCLRKPQAVGIAA